MDKYDLAFGQPNDSANIKIGGDKYDLALKNISQIEQKQNNLDNESDNPLGDIVAHYATGALAAPISGWAGIGSAIKNLSIGKGAETINKTNNDLIFQPKDNFSNKVIESPLNPMNYPGEAAQSVGGKLADSGHPIAATAAHTAIELAPMIFGGLKSINRQKSPEVQESINPSTNSSVDTGNAYKPPKFEDLPSETQKQIISQRPNITPDEASRHIESQTLPVPIDLTEGQMMQNPKIISDEMNNRGSKEMMVNRLNDQNTKLIQNIDAIKNIVAPDVTHLNPVDSGQGMVDSYKSIIKNDSDIRDQNYQNLRDANGGKFPIDAQKFAENAKNALNEGEKQEFLPSTFAKKLDDYSNGKAMNFDNFENLRSQLAEEMRRADRAGDGNTKNALSVVRGELENLPLSDDIQDNIKPLADTARASAKLIFDKAKSDPAYDSVLNDKTEIGSYSPLADNFVDRFLLKGKRANLETMKNNLSAVPDIDQIISGATLDHLKKSAGIDMQNNGNFSQAGYNKALSNIMPKIDFLLDPDSAKSVQQIGNVARYTQSQPRGSYVNNSNTFVANAANAAKTAAEMKTNFAAGGLPVGTLIRNIAEKTMAGKQADKSLNPVGQTNLSDMVKGE